jgi:uncharacterized protein (DUF302 family)
LTALQFNPTMIFGFCMPKVAHEIMSIEAATALLIPCNVAVREFEPGRVEVACMEGFALLGLVAEKEAIFPLIQTVRAASAKAMADI